MQENSAGTGGEGQRSHVLGLWRHQTGRIFSSGYGPSRLWTRAAPPPIRFARRRLRKICRSLSFEHVVTSAFVLKRRIRDVIAPLPTRGVRKQKSHTSRNPTSQPVFDWLDVVSSRNPTSFRLVGFSSSRNPTSFLDWLDFHPREIQPVFFACLDFRPLVRRGVRPTENRWLAFVRPRLAGSFISARRDRLPDSHQPWLRRARPARVHVRVVPRATSATPPRATSATPPRPARAASAGGVRYVTSSAQKSASRRSSARLSTVALRIQRARSRAAVVSPRVARARASSSAALRASRTRPRAASWDTI